MSKKEAVWFATFLTGITLINLGQGWQAVTFGLGAGILFWMAGRALR